MSEKKQELLDFCRTQNDGKDITEYDIVKDGNSYNTPIGTFEVLTEQPTQEEFAKILETSFKNSGSKMFEFVENGEELWKEICENCLTDKAKETLRNYIEDDILSQFETGYYDDEIIQEYFEISEEEYNNNSKSYDEKYIAEQADYYIKTEGYFEYFDDRDNDGSIYLYNEKVDFDFDSVAKRLDDMIKEETPYIYKSDDNKISKVYDMIDEILDDNSEEFENVLPDDIMELLDNEIITRETLENKDIEEILENIDNNKNIDITD